MVHITHNYSMTSTLVNGGGEERNKTSHIIRLNKVWTVAGCPLAPKRLNIHVMPFGNLATKLFTRPGDSLLAFPGGGMSQKGLQMLLLNVVPWGTVCLGI